MMYLKNYMEDLVWGRLDEVLAGHPNACHCEQCRYDVVALTLNALPTRYVATDKGETYVRIEMLEQQFYIDIISAISRSLIVVSHRPRHKNVVTK